MKILLVRVQSQPWRPPNIQHEAIGFSREDTFSELSLMNLTTDMSTNVPVAFPCQMFFLVMKFHAGEGGVEISPILRRRGVRYAPIQSRIPFPDRLESCVVREDISVHPKVVGWEQNRLLWIEYKLFEFGVPKHWEMLPGIGGHPTSLWKIQNLTADTNRSNDIIGIKANRNGSISDDLSLSEFATGTSHRRSQDRSLRKRFASFRSFVCHVSMGTYG